MMKNTFKILSLILAICALAFCFVSCSDEPTGKAKYDTTNTGAGVDLVLSRVKAEIGSMEVSDFEPSDQKSDYVLIKVKDYGEIVVLLRSDIAPITVKNFKKLVADDFYNDTIFHRVMKGFMIQGGGGTSIKDGMLESKYTDPIKGEFFSNGVTNKLLHYRGVISMARTSDLNSASSQFFIMHQDNHNLNGLYASFGYVLAGMDVVDAIAKCEVDAKDANAPVPVVPVVIESTTFVQPK